MKPIIKLLIIMCVISVSSCKKDPTHNALCNTNGTIRDSKELDVTCEGIYIESDKGTIYQPFGGVELLKGFKTGDKIKFGFQIIYLRMRSCGDVTTVKLTCAEKISKTSN